MSDRFEERLSILKDKMDEAGVDHFLPRELCRLDNPNWEYQSIYPPPERLIENIIPTVKLADKIRETWGEPVVCVSGWRPPTYNDMLIDGANDSQHMYFHALDLQPANAEYSKFVDHVEEVVEQERGSGKIIGLGRYRTFIHIDTGHYSYNRDWDSR